MSYKLHPERYPAEEIGRIALEELDAAVAELDDKEADDGERSTTCANA